MGLMGDLYIREQREEHHKRAAIAGFVEDTSTYEISYLIASLSGYSSVSGPGHTPQPRRTFFTSLSE